MAGGTAPDGTPCSNGECVAGVCEFVPVNPDPVSQLITVGCGNNVTSDVTILPFTLDVDPGPIVNGQPITADLGGIANFAEPFLDAAQGAVPGGVTKAGLVDLNADVQVRAGSSANVVTGLTGGGSIPYECVLSDTGPGAQEPCDPIDNQASIPGLQPNTGCAVVGSFNPCLRIVQVPISSDCAAGGVCDGLGKLAQCAANGFCVTDGLPIPFDAQLGVPMGTADNTDPDLLVGWFDNPADASVAVGTPAIDPDGTYNMLQPAYSGIAGPVGLALNAGGLAVQLECVMAEDSGGVDGVGVPDDASPTPNANLISFPVQTP